MCFSAEADLVAGTVVATAAAVGISNVRRRQDWPLAVLPLVLGVHLFAEALVWLGLRGGFSEGWRPPAWTYLVIAFVIVPVLVPFAIGATEPQDRRTRFVPFAVAGVAAAIVLGRGIVAGPVDTAIDGHHIAYHVPIWFPVGTVTCYLFATCGSAFVARDPAVRAFGVLNVAAVIALLLLQRNALTSLWCAWAAMTSVLIAAHLGFHRSRADRSALTATG